MHRSRSSTTPGVPPGGGEFEAGSAVSKIQDALIAEGVVVVWAAGHDGGEGSKNVVNPPARRARRRACSGSPTTTTTRRAPGTNILQACTYALTICRAHGDLRYPNYAEIRGTSMAAPHIAGIAAQLYQAGASSPAEVEDVLEDTAYKFSFGAPYEDDPRNPDDQTSFDRGHGLVDVLAAIEVVTGTDVDGDGSIGTGSDATHRPGARTCARRPAVPHGCRGRYHDGREE